MATGEAALWNYAVGDEVWVIGTVIDFDSSDETILVHFNDAESVWVDSPSNIVSWGDPVKIPATIRYVNDDWDGFDLTITSWRSDDEYIIAGKEYVCKR